MATINFKKGLLANLPNTHAEGTVYITTDERAIYLDVSDSARIRLGDFQEFATVAALEANTNPSTTALYYVSAINCLAKWDGTKYVQINLDTGATSFEVHKTGDVADSGNVVTNITYDSATRKVTFYKGITAAEVGNNSTDTKDSITLYGVKKYAKDLNDTLLGNANDSSSAETVRGARALANSKLASITAGDGISVSTSSPNSATAPEVGIKLSAKSGNSLSIQTGSGEEGLYYKAPVVAVQEKSSPNTGYLKTYQITVDGTPVSVDIDIPKDFLVKGASIGTVIADDKATGGKFENESGFSVGDKYLDFVVNVKSGSATDEHIYLNVKDLAHVYTAGNGIAISASDGISIAIDNTSVGGLTVGANGLKLAVVTPDSYSFVAASGKFVSGTTYYTSSAGTSVVDTSAFEEGVTDVSSYYVRQKTDGVGGAMSSADKYKLDNVAEGAQVNVLEGVQIDGTDLTANASKKVNLVCNTAYNASTNKLATMSDVGTALTWGSF